MRKAMNHVGKAICESYHWIPTKEPSWLVTDKTGGHGILEYRQIYKIIHIYKTTHFNTKKKKWL